MSPTRTSRVSRKGEIPGNFILNWQSSSTNRGTRPLVRRPLTACERCRTAKVKCSGDGQHECTRCTSRGVECTYYTQSAPVPSPALSSSPGLTVSHPESPCYPQHPPDRDPSQEEIQMGFGGADPAAFNQQPLDSCLTDWSAMNSLQPESAGHMDWSTVDPGLDWTFPPTTHQPNPTTGLDLLSGTTNTTTTTTNNNTMLTPSDSSTLMTPERNFLTSRGLFPLITSTTAADLPWQSQFGSHSCQCRAGLALLIPKARAAVQAGRRGKERLDNIFTVTGDVIRRCQEIVRCTGCHVNCTDLICIMAVFQEADICFEYLAKKESDDEDDDNDDDDNNNNEDKENTQDGIKSTSTATATAFPSYSITVSMGSYEMKVTGRDAKRWRRMLVVDLVSRAIQLLDMISATGQDMLKELAPGCRLGRVNIEYLEAVIGNSRDNFQNILKRF